MRHMMDARALLRRAQVEAAFADWLRGDGSDLVESAELLGGSAWAARAAAVVEAARDGEDLAGRLRELRALRRLLRLELADDPDGLEATRFAGIHSDDPRADAVRLCAEALDRGVAALEARVRAADQEAA